MLGTDEKQQQPPSQPQQRQQQVLLQEVIPRKEDVKLGKGPSCYNHAGTVYLRNLVERFLPLYQGLPYGQKNEVVIAIIKSVHENLKGRFIYYNQIKRTWIELTDPNMLKRKILHRFHCKVLRGRRQKEGGGGSSSSSSGKSRDEHNKHDNDVRGNTYFPSYSSRPSQSQYNISSSSSSLSSLTINDDDISCSKENDTKNSFAAFECHHQNEPGNKIGRSSKSQYTILSSSSSLSSLADDCGEVDNDIFTFPAPFQDNKNQLRDMGGASTSKKKEALLDFPFSINPGSIPDVDLSSLSSSSSLPLFLQANQPSKSNSCDDDEKVVILDEIIFSDSEEKEEEEDVSSFGTFVDIDQGTRHGMDVNIDQETRHGMDVDIDQGTRYGMDVDIDQGFRHDMDELWMERAVLLA